MGQVACSTAFPVPMLGLRAERMGYVLAETTEEGYFLRIVVAGSPQLMRLGRTIEEANRTLDGLEAAHAKARAAGEE